MKNYELIEHTADVGIRVKSRDLDGLFKEAAIAMFEIIAQKKSKIKNQKLKVRIIQKAIDLEELFVNWLNELLSLSSAREIIFTDFKIGKLTETDLEADVFAEVVAHFNVNSEIKAATRHGLKIEKTGFGWQAEVIFDV